MDSRGEHFSFAAAPTSFSAAPSSFPAAPRHWGGPYSRPRHGSWSRRSNGNWSRPPRGETPRYSSPQFGSWRNEASSPATSYGSDGRRSNPSPESAWAAEEVPITAGLLVDLHSRCKSTWEYLGPPRQRLVQPCQHPAVVTRVHADGKCEVASITSFGKQHFVQKWPAPSFARKRYFPFADDTTRAPAAQVNPDGKTLLAFTAMEQEMRHPLTYGSYVNGDDCWLVGREDFSPRQGGKYLLDAASVGLLRGWSTERDQLQRPHGSGW